MLRFVVQLRSLSLRVSLVVDLYTSVLYVLMLACAGIGQDLAYSDFVTLSVCSGNIAITSKKKMHVLEVNYINPGPKKRLSAIFVRQILYTIKV